MPKALKEMSASDPNASEVSDFISRIFGPDQLRLTPSELDPFLVHTTWDDVQRFLDAIPGEVALADEDWTIIAANEAWTRARRSRADPPLPGSSYLQIWEACAKHNQDAASVPVALRRISAGRSRSFRRILRRGKRGSMFEFSVTSFHRSGTRLAMICWRPLRPIDLPSSPGGKAFLFAALDDERRKIGRELHDSTSQLLVVLHLNLLRLKVMQNDERSEELIEETAAVLAKVNKEIRAVSYLLHPPPLGSGSLADALSQLAQGFARRTDLQIFFSAEGDAEICPPAMKGTLYRVAQEALANVYHHAHARTVWMQLSVRRGRFVHLTVRDDGVGFPALLEPFGAKDGVGLVGMRYRMREVSGRLSIRSGRGGTALAASANLDILGI